jgi:hypothetical protein
MFALELSQGAERAQEIYVVIFIAFRIQSDKRDGRVAILDGTDPGKIRRRDAGKRNVIIFIAFLYWCDKTLAASASHAEEN